MADGNIIAQRWFVAAELAGLAGVPGTDRGLHKFAERAGWQRRRRTHGKGWEYPFTSLPPEAQAALLLRERPALAPMIDDATAAVRSQGDRVESAWAHYHAASDRLKALAAERLQALSMVQALVDLGTSLMQARALVSAQLQREQRKGASVGNLARWAVEVAGVARKDWLALLVPSYVGRTAEAACSPEAWDWYKSYWLTRKQPTHAETYRRLMEIATARGWSVPSAKTLVRRIEREVPPITQALLREGAEAAGHLTPVQKRDRSVFVAGEAVNGDGLKLDKLWVKFEDGEVLNTATVWAWQDLRSNKFLAWRLGKTESTELFRLATYDLTGVCAPRHYWMDNTRVAANKEMTAGANGRHRFKSDPADGLGLLLMIGGEPHFTNPDKELGNPGSKPIERAFGIGGLHSEVANNPRFGDRGYSKATAVPVEELREVIAFEVARFNARPNRKTQACRGVLSFDQVWDESVAQHPPRVLAEVQRRMLLMCREAVRADDSGTVTIRAGRSAYDSNRYWSESSVRLAGRRLVAMYDPDNLPGGVHLYSLDGRYLCAAEHMPGRAYNDKQAGAEDAKLRIRLTKLNKKTAAETARIDALERAKLYAEATGQPPAAPQAKRKTQGNVVTGVFQKPIAPQRDAARPAATGTDGGLTKLDKLILQRMERLREDAI